MATAIRTLSTDDARARLRASGLRTTAPRLAVLLRLEEEDAPRSHGELCEALASLGFDRATVYRNLVDLTEAGLVERTDLGDRVWRFEAKRARPATSKTAAKRPAARFVCADCGAVLRLDDVRVDVRGPHADARVDEILLRGRCRRCC